MKTTLILHKTGVCFAMLVCVATAYAQNSCRNTCATKFPGTQQASQLNACYATCNTTATPTATGNPAETSQGAGQNGQVSQSAQELNNARVQETNAQLDKMQAEQQARSAATGAAQAGLETGMIQGTLDAGKANYDKRVGMVRDALNGPKAKAYTNRSGAVVLSDPFAVLQPEKVSAGDSEFLEALAGTCLEMGGKDHPLARVIACKAPSSCKKMPAIGLYPTLPDSRFIDSPETLAFFQKLCRDPSASIQAVDENGVASEVK